jgi:hypothetical protein
MTWGSSVERKKGEVQIVQAVQPLRSVQSVLQPKNKFQSFQWFHRLRGSKRTDSQSLAKEISPTGEGVNASRRGSRFNGSKVQRRIYSKTVPVVPSHEKATGNSRSKSA